MSKSHAWILQFLPFPSYSSPKQLLLAKLEISILREAFELTYDLQVTLRFQSSNSWGYSLLLGSTLSLCQNFWARTNCCQTITLHSRYSSYLCHLWWSPLSCSLALKRQASLLVVLFLSNYHRALDTDFSFDWKPFECLELSSIWGMIRCKIIYPLWWK